MIRYRVKRNGCLSTKRSKIRLTQKQFWYVEKKEDGFECTRDNVTVVLTEEQVDAFFEVC